MFLQLLFPNVALDEGGNETNAVGKNDCPRKSRKTAEDRSDGNASKKFHRVDRIEDELISLSLKAEQGIDENTRSKVKHLTENGGDNIGKCVLKTVAVKQFNGNWRYDQTAEEYDCCANSHSSRDDRPQLFRQTTFVFYKIAQDDGVDRCCQHCNDFSDQRCDIIRRNNTAVSRDGKKNDLVCVERGVFQNGGKEQKGDT